MRLWVSEKHASIDNRLGFLDVRPDSAAEFLVMGGYAVEVNAGLQTPPCPEAKWLGNSAIVVVADHAPVVTQEPVISGLSAVGSVLTCTPGEYGGQPAPTVVRQWEVDGTPVSGQTSLMYTIQAGDSGLGITCAEMATNTGGSVEAMSNVIVAD